MSAVVSCVHMSQGDLCLGRRKKKIEAQLPDLLLETDLMQKSNL